MKFLIFLSLILLSALPVQAWDLDLAAGYNMLEIENFDGSKAFSNGFSGQLGAHYSLVQREKFRFGIRALGEYSEMKNDANTSLAQEQTRLFTVGAGVEMRIHRFFVGVLYTYHRPEIRISGVLNNSERYSFYSPHVELGYELELSHSALRLYYRRTDTEIPRADTGFASDSGYTSHGFFLGLRFHLGHPAPAANTYESSYSSDYMPSTQSTSGESSFYSTPSVDNSRRNSFRPRPSTRLSY